MKKFYSFAVLSMLAGAGMVAQAGTESESVKKSIVMTAPVQIESHSGEEVVSSLRQGYRAGVYKQLLSNLESEYQKVAQEGRIQEISAMRNSYTMDAEEQAFSARWEALSKQLIQERNCDLLEIAQNSSDPLLAKRIQSATKQLSDEQNEALYYLSSLRAKSLDQAASAEEKTLIEIDLAAEIKMLQLESQSMQASTKERMEQQMVLRFEMLDKMQQASEFFKDEALKKKIAVAVEASENAQARFWDLNQLKLLSKKPSNEAEKKVSLVLSSYKTKESDLYREEIAKLQP